jgi:hypothetical protein
VGGGLCLCELFLPSDRASEDALSGRTSESEVLRGLER